MNTPSESTAATRRPEPQDAAPSLASQAREHGAAFAATARVLAAQAATRLKPWLLSGGVRDLTRWRVPFHFAPAILVALVGVLLLLSGGVAGFFGGWALAVALPIAIGAFLASPFFALAPSAVWALWLIASAGAADDAALSNTPVKLAVLLSIVGAGATLLAQRAIFPATEPAAWESGEARTPPPLDDGETPELDEPGPDHTIAFVVVEPIEATDEEIDAAEAARRADLEKATIEAIAPHVEAAEKVTEFEALEGEDLSGAEGIEVVEAEAASSATVNLLKHVATEPATTEPSIASADELSAATTDETLDAEPAQAPTAHVELPVDADPAPLDEGGHVTEFAAISQADVDAAQPVKPKAEA